MCGIVGIHLSAASWSLQSTVVPEACVQAMAATLGHRGPDGRGWFGQGPVALGHTRLSILDLSDAGAQPMALASGPAIAYNGECYNFRELRLELEALGIRFRGGSDTEVILQAYVAWGLDGLKRLEGMFAFALWDQAAQRLVLMRDRVGIKPLFYGESSHGLAFGSEIKAVLAAGGVDTALDDQAFSEYLWYGNAFEDRTFYRGVRALPPGHWLIVENGRRRLESWWRIEEYLEKDTLPSGFADATARVRSALDQAVHRQLVADVPVGLFLSGGVDSSAIAAAAVHGGLQSMTSYSAGFDFDGGIDELPKAAMVAAHLRLDHHELRISGVDLPEVLLALARAHDEPFADAANIPLYLMCQRLQGRIKVVLQGDGGDELFAGYRRYAVLQNALWWRLWPRFLSPVARCFGNSGRRFARMADAASHSDAAMRMALLLTMETPQEPPLDLLTSERHAYLARTTDPFLAYRRAAERFKTEDPVQQMLLTDLTVQLPSQFLPKVDRASMAASIETRVPLLDERLMELVVGLPSRWKARGTQKKRLLRAAQRGRLPDTILDAPKAGFGVPYEHWLRTSLHAFAKDRLLDQSVLKRFDLQPKAVEDSLGRLSAGQMNQGFKLWKLLQLAIWEPRVS